jgi:integrase
VDAYGTVRLYGRVAHAGRRHHTPRRRVGPRLSEAAARRLVEADLRALAARLRADDPPDPRRDATTLGPWLERWIEGERGKVERSSWNAYDALLRLHVVPYLGHLRLSQLRPPVLLAWRAALARDGRSPDRIRKAETVLRLALKDAAAAEYPVPDALFRLERVGVKREKRPHVTEAQFLKLCAVAPEPWRTVYATAFYGMLRDGELRGLDWGHVLWASGQLDVRQQYARDRSEKAPKHGSAGIVDVPAEVVVLLDAHRRRLELGLGRPVRPDDAVFPGPRGGRWSHEGARQTLKRHLKEARLPADLTWHSFRRGGATAHSAEAIDPFTLQQLMRHTTLGTTEGYLRPVVRGGKEAAERLAKRVRGS